MVNSSVLEARHETREVASLRGRSSGRGYRVQGLEHGGRSGRGAARGEPRGNVDRAALRRMRCPARERP